MGDFQGVVGVAGCGAMGLPMAQRLQAAGITVWGYDVRQISGAFAPRMIADARTFANGCDVVISVVRDAAQTRELLFDVQSILHAENPPRTVIISSTLSPRFLRDIAVDIEQLGLRCIDAPMSGAPFSAAQGTLSFMIGATASETIEVTPLFKAMGTSHHYLDGLGAGMTAKVLNNMVAASSVAATRQAARSDAIK